MHCKFAYVAATENPYEGSEQGLQETQTIPQFVPRHGAGETKKVAQTNSRLPR